MTDPILKELWDIKDELAQECGNDIARLFDKLKTAQKSVRGPLVNRNAQRPKTIVKQQNHTN